MCSLASTKLTSLRCTRRSGMKSTRISNLWKLLCCISQGPLRVCDIFMFGNIVVTFLLVCLSCCHCILGMVETLMHLDVCCGCTCVLPESGRYIVVSFAFCPLTITLLCCMPFCRVYCICFPPTCKNLLQSLNPWNQWACIFVRTPLHSDLHSYTHTY